MRAGRARDRCLGTLVQVTAVAAPPDHRLVLLEDRTRLDVCEKPEVTLLVLLLSDHDSLEYLGYLLEALVPRYLGEPRVHLGPLVVPVSYTHLRAHETRHDLVCR